MIKRIKELETLQNYVLKVTFDDDIIVYYDVKEDINTLPNYCDLMNITGLFDNIKLDESRTYVYWNDYIDLPSDILYEYGKRVNN